MRNNDMVRASEAARACGVPYTTLLSALQTKRIPGVYIRPGWLVRIEDIKAYEWPKPRRK